MTNTPPPDGFPSEHEATEPADLTGTVLAGRYRIERKLGGGGMGAVYLGEHLRMGRRDAIKVLKPGTEHDPDAIARFTRGARTVARIRHPNVCQVYDFGETEDGLLFLAMEFVEGPTLTQLLDQEGPLDPDRAVRFLVQAAEALQVAHDQGIIHRDLKPDNLMVFRAPDGTEQLKVVDFDIARGPQEEGAGVTRHGFVVGTPHYMSPEQLTGDTLDARSDVYSLALVLFRALAGRLPFEGKSAQEVMIQRLTTEPLRLSQAAPGRTFPASMETVLHRALAKLPAQRPSTVRAFAEQVSETLGGAPARTAATEQIAQDATVVVDRTAFDLAATRQPPPGDLGATEVLAGPALPPGGGTAFPGSGVGQGPGGGGAGIPGTVVGPGAHGGGPFVPGTVVGPGPQGGGLDIPGTVVAPTPTAPGGRETRRRAMLAGAAVLVGLLALGGTGAALGWFGGAGGGAAAADAGAAGSPDAAFAEADSGGDPAPEGGATQAGGGQARTGDAGPAGTAGGQQAAARDGPATDPAAGRDPQPPPTTSTPTVDATPPLGGGGGGAAAPARVDVGSGNVRDLLFNQYLRIGEQDSRDVLLAARDTADAVYHLEGASREDRAFAAHILGLVLIPLRDSIRGVEFLEEAVRLDPRDNYILVRDLYRPPLP